MSVKLERLASLGIELVPMPGLERHFVFARGTCASLVEKVPGGFGRIGTSGVISEHGLALLVWREGKPWLVAKNHEQEATAAEVADLRQFSSDLERALRAC